MNSWRQLFVGRAAELDHLRSSWLRAKAGKPQVVSIVAETGFGKTRLVQEFFSWLSTVEDGTGDRGYWPDQLLRLVDNLQVNPDPADCAADGRAMPFMWWGLRLTDPGGRNEIITTALRPAEEYLRAHLAAYVRTMKLAELRRQQVRRGGSNLADIGLDAIGMVPGLGTVFSILNMGKTLVEAGHEGTGLEREIRALEGRTTVPKAAIDSQRTDLTKLIFEDLRRVVHAPPEGMSAIPAILFIDDAQWLRLDPTLGELIRKILAAASKESWPLLILVTSWEKEWRLSGSEAVAALFAATGIESREIMLGRAPELGQLVAVAFPGLSPSQTKLLLERADGNPRFLDEILTRLQRAPGMFINRNQAGALTEGGARLVATERIEEVVRDRLLAAPRHVQGALGLASLQGIRFSPAVVVAVAPKVGIAAAREGLIEGETPFAFVSGSGGDMGEFRARFYHAAALENLPNLVDPDVAVTRLREALVALSPSNAVRSDDILEAQVALFGSEDTKQRATAFRALAELVRKADAHHDLLTAGRLAARWASEALSETDALSAFDDIVTVASALRDIGDDAMARALLERVREQQADPRASASPVMLPTQRMKFLHELGLVRSDAGDDKAAVENMREFLRLARQQDGGLDTVQKQQALASALDSLGDVLQNVEGPEAALPLIQEALAIRRGLDEAAPSYHNRRGLSLSLERIATVLKPLEGVAATLPYLQQALAIKEELVVQDYIPVSRRDLSVMLYRVGYAFYEMGEMETALPYLARSNTVAKALAADLGTSRSREDHTYTLRGLGEALLVTSPASALPYFQEACDIWREIAAERSDRMSRKSLSVNLQLLAGCLSALEGPDAALPMYREAYSLIRGVTEDGYYVEEYGRCVVALGGAVASSEGPAEAISLYREAVAPSERLAADPGTVAAISSYVRVMDAYAALVAEHEGWPAAMPLRNSAFASRQRLTELYPSARIWADLAYAHGREFLDCRRRRRFIAAAGHWGRAVAARIQAARILVAHGWPIGRIKSAFADGTVPDLLVPREPPVAASAAAEPADIRAAVPLADPGSSGATQKGSRSGKALDGGQPARNAPCPCGSGRKYKHCHGRLQ